MNNPEKTHRTLYLVYKQNENRVIIRHGTQVLSEEGVKAIKKITELQEQFVKSQYAILSEANLKYQPALRFESLLKLVLELSLKKQAMKTLLASSQFANQISQPL